MAKKKEVPKNLPQFRYKIVSEKDKPNILYFNHLKTILKLNK